MTYDEPAGALSSAAPEKEERLIDWLRARGAVAIGYSGGVDSAYLAAVAVETLGAENVLGIIGRSASYPESQWVNARQIAERIGLPVIEVDTDELNDPRYAANPTNRCYFCKTELWTRLEPVARDRGIGTLCDGTNADDVHDYRPGAQAAREHAIHSPLALVGMTKAEIRERSRARGLPTWAQPSSPCLSSRLPYGTAVTVARLKRVERAEDALRALGVSGDLRVRHFGSKARVELSPSELARWSAPAERERLEAAVIATGYREVEIDPRGFRSGALNALAGVTAPSQDHAARATVSGD
ncbi:MAG TPA: ATP-dependent sacrificial sulfur transferase LarE [Gemmatimonadaceae bacterium]|nr:ATP-dependent sacrificial sulfur transferase LarE [Gemmatimonadaceae bacterium]